MCLITEQEECFIAEDDIICYKVLLKDNNRFNSIYFQFKWIVDKLNKTKLTKQKQNFANCCFLDNESHDCYIELYSKSDLLNSINEGFHAILKLGRFGNMQYYPLGSVICKMSIPKGSEYFLDRSGLIVANQMIFIEEVQND